MDALDWIVAYYPVGIILLGTVSQFLVSISGDEGSPPPSASELEKTHLHTKNAKTISQQQMKPPNLSERPDLEDQQPPTTIHSRSTAWLSAFLVSLQFYCLLKMGSIISLAQQENPSFVWTAPIVLFSPTFMILESIVKLIDALERVGSPHRYSAGSNGRYFLYVEVRLIAVLIFLIPWIQAGWALIKHLIAPVVLSKPDELHVHVCWSGSVLQVCYSTVQGVYTCLSSAVEQTGDVE